MIDFSSSRPKGFRSFVSLLVSCSRHRLVLGLGRTYSEIVGFGVLSFGLRATSNGFCVWLATSPLLARLLYSLFFTIVFHTMFTPEGTLRLMVSSARLALVAQPAASRSAFDPPQFSGRMPCPAVTETIGGLFTFPVTTSLRSSPSEPGCN